MTAASVSEMSDDQGRATPLESLLTRMRSGDREAAATFIMTYGTRIRRRIRGKLGPSMRRLFDSQEILSTLGRRLDLYVRDRKLEASEEGQLWSLVFRMAENAMVDKARVYRRLQSVEGSDSPFARDLLGRLQRAEASKADGAEAMIELAVGSLPDETDQQILTLWLNGTRHSEIAVHLEMSAAAVRKRWERIKGTLRSVLSCHSTE